MRNSTIILALALLTVLAGCKHKDNTTPSPQAQAPTITPDTQPVTQPSAPPVTPPAETTTPETASNPPATSTTPSTATPTTPKPKPRRPSSASTHKSNTAANPQTAQKPGNAAQPATGTPQQAPTQQASNRPAATPGADATAPPASPGMPTDEALHTRGTTDQLLQATEANLRRINRQLSPAEQKTVDEIKNYMQRARSAQTDGDLNLAHNYAVKAHQLSDVLVGQ